MASKNRRTATLWFVAAALSLAAALLTYKQEHRWKWPLLAAATFMAAVGIRYWKGSSVV